MNTIHEAIIERAAAGVRRKQIAEEFGRSVNTVYWIIARARQQGAEIRHGNSLPVARPDIRLSLRWRTLHQLQPYATARGVSVRDLAAEILLTVARDGLVDAVLDDGGRDD